MLSAQWTYPKITHNTSRHKRCLLIYPMVFSHRWLAAFTPFMFHFGWCKIKVCFQPNGQHFIDEHFVMTPRITSRQWNYSLSQPFGCTLFVRSLHSLLVCVCVCDPCQSVYCTYMFICKKSRNLNQNFWQQYAFFPPWFLQKTKNKLHCKSFCCTSLLPH